MKVLMLGWELPPHNSGGLGVACYQLCKSLAAKSIDLEFVLPYQTGDVPFMKVTAAMPQGVSEVLRAGNAYDSYKYIYHDGHSEWLNIFQQQAGYEQSVAQLAEASRFDIVHAHDWLTFRAALRLKLKTNCPIVLHVHSVESDRAGGGPGNPLVRDIEALAFSMADHIIAVSELTRRKVATDYAIPLERIEVVHNSIDAGALDALEADNSYRAVSALKAQGYGIICNIGRFTVQKGLPNLLRAAQLVIQRRPKTMLLLVGTGEQYEELIDLAAELGIGRNVLFAGFQRGKSWRDAFAVADLFVMPSLSEPFGLTPLEAANYGTPSLISKQSGISEVLKNCLKVDYWDINEMANQMLAALHSPALTTTLLDGAAAEVRRMSWQKAADRIYDAYRQQLQRSDTNRMVTA